MKKNQNGFGLVEIVLILVIVMVVGVLCWITYSAILKNNKTNNAITSQSKQQQIGNSSSTGQTVKNNLYVISNVSLTLPEGWYVDDDNIPPYFKNLVKEVSIVPREKLRTVYGDGNEYFHIYFSVYSNPSHLSAVDWFTGNNGGNGEGVAAGSTIGDETQIVNGVTGRDTVYRYENRSGYHEVYYVYAKDETISYIYARTYETKNDLPGVGDFTKFEPQIESMSRSVNIK